MGTATTGNASKFADTAVFPLSIRTAAIRSETEAERERQRDMQTDREREGGGSTTESDGDVRVQLKGMLSGME